MQDFLVANEADTDVINKTELRTITITSSLESNAYLMTTTPSDINELTPRATPTFIPTPTPTSTQISTSTPTSTSTTTSTPTITMTPTRRVIFGQPLSSSERTVVSTPTPTFFLGEREKNGLPSIVILEVMVSEEGFRPKLLLANFGYTISMASWKLYFDQQLVCTFGEYIFWPDTVLTLDVSRNLEEKTADDQLILKCEPFNKEIFSRPVVIKLQDHTGGEVDRYIYEKIQ